MLVVWRRIIVIRVLQSWQEIGDSILGLQQAGLPTHPTAQKNWDHFLLRELLATTSRKALVVDLGCGEGHALSLLHALGFKKLQGLDLQIDWRARARQLSTIRRGKTLRLPFRLLKRDITRTSFPSESYDVAVSISTIEHGVDIESFLGEARRILRPGGLLFITTDYWENKIPTNGTHVYGLPWQIFCRDQVEALITSAGELGLKLVQEATIPLCLDQPVSWQNSNYTFVALAFRKNGV
jgi:SAM-dependent methyltransferase